MVQLAIHPGCYHASGSRQPGLAADGWKDGRNWHTGKPPPSCSKPLHLHDDLLTPAESRAVIKGQNYLVSQSNSIFPFGEGHGGFREHRKLKDDHSLPCCNTISLSCRFPNVGPDIKSASEMPAGSLCSTKFCYILVIFNFYFLSGLLQMGNIRRRNGQITRRRLSPRGKRRSRETTH